MLKQGEILRERYEIQGLLGQGGMGAVYEAFDRVFDTTVAVKEIVIDLSNSQNTDAKELVHHAFEREAKLLAKINHETFPHVKDYFSSDNRQFLIMELVDGEDLAKLLSDRGEPFDSADLISWAHQILDGLDYLHTQTPPIIHRDLKPQNLKLNSRGKMKLLDFGIAKGTDSGNANTVTDQTFIAATLNFSPIEQMVRVIDPTFLAVITHKYESDVTPLLNQNADPRSDIYALGATLYNLSTGRAPVEAIKRGVDVWEGKPDPLPKAHEINPELPIEFSKWISQSMEINRNLRFESALKMRIALEQISNSGRMDSRLEDTAIFHVPSGEAKTALAPNQTNNTNEVHESAKHAVGEDSVETIVIPPNHVPPKSAPNALSTQGAPDTHSTVADHESTPKRKGFSLLWLIPLALLPLMVFGAAAGGGFWYLTSADGANSEVVSDSNTNSNSENDTTDSSEILAVGDDSAQEDPNRVSTSDPSNSTAPKVGPPKNAPAGRNSSSKPNTSAKTEATQTPARTRTPTRRNVERRGPPNGRRPPPPPGAERPPRRPRTPEKRNMRCIYADDC